MDPIETDVWTWALDGRGVVGGDTGCTLCRASRADQYLTLYRTLPKSRNKVWNAMQALRAGIKAPATLALNEPTFWSDLRELLASSGYPIEEVWVQSTHYKRKGKPKTASIVGTMVPAWKIPYDRLGSYERSDFYMHPDGYMLTNRTNGLWQEDWTDGSDMGVRGFHEREKLSLVQYLTDYLVF